MNGLFQDIRFGLRQLGKSPGFTAVAIITLALGIGASTAIFSVVNTVLLRPLPYKDDGRLAVILHQGRNPVSPANFIDWQNQSHAFESMGAAEYWTPNLTGTDNPEKLWALHVSTTIFPMLGVQPLLGRVFLPQEQEIGKEHEVLLSFQLWQRHFASDPNVLGQSMELSGEPYTIVGVMPREFSFAPFWATRSELWAPLALGSRRSDRAGGSLRVFARLKPGVTLAQAQGEMGAITGRLEREFPGTNRDMKVLSLREKVVGNVRPALLALFGAVGFVLLIACANVSHMLLARSAARQRESALRSALGARHWDLVRQFLTEGLLLASAGGCAGLLLAMWGVRVLLALAPANIPRVETVDIDARVLLFAASISLLSGLVFGVAPVWRVNAANLSEALKKTERGSSEEASQGRWRGLLIGSEYALAVVLLAGAGLMIRTFLALQNVDPGFDPVNVLSMVVGVGGTTEATSGHTGNFYQEVLQRVSAVPGIESASAINHLPLAGDEWGRSFHVEGSPPERPGNAPIATYRAVFPGYFHTMQIPMLRGRDVAEADNLSASAVIVINEYLAHQYWPGEDPIGKRITFDDPAKSPVWLTVVGIVKNTVRTNWVDRPEEEVFLPYLQTRAYLENPSPPFAYFTLVVRANGDPSALAPAIQAAVHSVDRNVPVSEVQTMEHVAAAATGLSRFYLVLLGTFAAVALALAGVGIYGVMSYSVSRRVREIGIRMALGAERREVIRMVIRQGMLSALFGLAVGLVAAWGLTRLLGNVLYSVRPADPEAFVFASAALALVAFGASYIPARRAARVDPIVALRYE